MKPLSKKTSLRLPPSLHRKLTTLAQENGRSLNSELVSCLEAFFVRKEISEAAGSVAKLSPAASQQ
ncbi:toxin-antitoxin system HicB family antitoxin [Gluconobacter kondonii]|uniref:toxin-antitoxin system HicB family antitoxin n=1 Tax=Gluconobacter kondonii TaxID=941463 RepID=UPI001B8C3796|nr:toxin-antitoxin system HicB family antitoxin [Gluconobacter kondonii]MBS1077890.1 toxin-antitoxin system HicB family antitoxin [Gluconobacter kondonii]